MSTAATTARIVGNYVLRSTLGRGGTSEVYAAEHRFLGDPVALKLLRPHLTGDPAATESFLTEATRTRSIDHRHVVRVLDAGHDDATGRCYLVMERIAGDSLAARLRGTGPLAEPDARALFVAIAEGMQAVHAAGIIHRDLKPANIMLAESGPKIVDFGIAKFLGDADAATTTRRIGTPAYMAPEQITGGLIAPCTDIWAFGVILFEAVTGRLPFPDVADGRCPQLFEDAPRATDHAPISPTLARLIARCLEREPGRRPASMTELAAVLRGELDLAEERITQDAGELPPAHARPAAARTRVWWAIGGAAAIALGVSAALVVASMGDPAPVDLSASQPIVTPPATAVEPPPRVLAPAPPPPRAHTIEVRSTPPGAEIVVDGKGRGTTPRSIELATPTSIVVRRAGYHASRVQVAGADPIHVQLVPVRRSMPPAGAKPRTNTVREVPVKPRRETLD